MRSRILLRITSCVLVAVIVFLAAGSLLTDLDEALGVKYREFAIWLGENGVPEFFINALYMWEQALTFLAPLVFGLLIPVFLIERTALDRYTHV